VGARWAPWGRDVALQVGRMKCGTTEPVRPADVLDGSLFSDELSNWRSQFVTAKSDRMGLRHVPMAFTEQRVAMLSSVSSL